MRNRIADAAFHPLRRQLPPGCREREVHMIQVHRSMLVLGAVAFMSSEAAYAAPAQPVDPLLSLAVLAGGPSSAAVCAGSTAATAASAAAIQGAPGCVLPVTTPPPPPAVAQSVPPPVVATGAPKTIGTLPLLLGLAAIIAVAALLISGNDNGNGNAAPISPF
jgi:hypothetical protein